MTQCLSLLSVSSADANQSKLVTVGGWDGLIGGGLLRSWAIEEMVGKREISRFSIFFYVDVTCLAAGFRGASSTVHSNNFVGW
jgi:hypothetical protein